MPEVVERYDDLLKNDGPVAIVFLRKLKPIEGKDAWIFPPTFAQGDTADDDEGVGGGSYQIDLLPDDERRNVCLVDSIGSQANRIEPIFKKARYSALVPQVVIKMSGDDGDEINLLDAGHRAADAVVRFSKLYGPKLNSAFKTYLLKRDCSELVRLAPTSLVFGVWDSRATGAKIQRLVRSVIRAYNVIEGRRSAMYRAAYDYTGNGVIDPGLDKGSGKNNPLSQEGFKFSLASGTHGGVMVKGDIRQEAIINLVALRTLTSDLVTKRYLLGLALVALSYRDQEAFNLREGCLLCAASTGDLDGTWKAVRLDGGEDGELFKGFTHEDALNFAEEAAKNTKVEQPAPDSFDTETAQKWLAIDKKKRKSFAKIKHPAQAVRDEAAAAARNKERNSPATPGEN